MLLETTVLDSTLAHNMQVCQQLCSQQPLLKPCKIQTVSARCCYEAANQTPPEACTVCGKVCSYRTTVTQHLHAVMPVSYQHHDHNRTVHHAKHAHKQPLLQVKGGQLEASATYCSPLARQQGSRAWPLLHLLRSQHPRPARIFHPIQSSHNPHQQACCMPRLTHLVPATCQV